MSERTIDTGFWNDPFFQEKSFNAKGFYLYSWTNQHVNQAGLYEITMLTMTRETCLPEKDILSALEELKPKVIWYPDKSLLWVKAFVKRQGRSPKFRIAAGKCLEAIKDKKLVDEYLDYYQKEYSLSIPYTYPIDTLSIPSARAADKISGSGSGSGSLNNNTSSKAGEKRGAGGEEGEEMGVKDPKLAAIAVLYEQNVGQITPMVADKLIWIRDTFPEGWFQEALKEAINHNARSLAYITSILERWKAEGFKSDKKDRGKARKKGKTEGLKIVNE